MYASDQSRKRQPLARSSRIVSFHLPLRAKKHLTVTEPDSDLSSPARSLRVPFAPTSANELNLVRGRSPLKRSESILHFDQGSLVSPMAKRNARLISASTTPKHFSNPLILQGKTGEWMTPAPSSKLRKHFSVESFIAPMIHEAALTESTGGVYSVSTGKQTLVLSQGDQGGTEQDSGVKEVSSVGLMRTEMHEIQGRSFFTPQDYKLVKPLQTVFMSTGLLSKRNRPQMGGASMLPPDTPCKRPVILDILHTPVTPVGGRGDVSFSSQEESFEGIDLSFLYNSSSSEIEGPLTPTKGVFMETERYGKRWKIDSNTCYFSRSPTDLSVFQSVTRIPEQPGIVGEPAWGLRTQCTSVKKLEPPSPGLLTARFRNVELVGSGEFSEVYQVEERDGTAKFAVKRTKFAYSGSKERTRRLEEVNILRELGRHKHIIELYDFWEQSRYLYIQMELCDNGSLDIFLQEYGRIAKLDEFRVWKVLMELSLGIMHIHDTGYIHLDLKPANIFISYEGFLKIGDFGMASAWPVPIGMEREGDREYIAPEILSSQQYDKPADIFSLGLVILEVAANIVLPQNGLSWQKLRSGDLSDAPRLSSSKVISFASEEITTLSKPLEHRYIGQGGLDRIVKQMLAPNPLSRPTAKQILETDEVTWVNKVRKAGAIVYEGDYGPKNYSTNENDTNEDWRVGM